MPEAGGDTLPVANMLWVEGRLGALERACMRSVMAQGHRLVLWHYGALDGVPEGVELRAGDAVVPRALLFRHVPTGSHSLFSNLFRYRLLQLDQGLWFDSDMYLLKPIVLGDGHIFGLQEPGLVAIGIFGLPADNPILSELIEFYDARRIPPWLPLRWQLRYAWQRARRGTYRLETMPWGNLGPRAVTAMLGKYGLTQLARPSTVFSPWNWPEADWVLRPGERLEDRIKPETLAAHLFNQMLGERKNEAPAPGSFLERLHREGA
jgi:hypothetical protein